MRHGKEFDNFSSETEVVNAMKRITGERGRPFCLMYDPFLRRYYSANGRESAHIFSSNHEKVEDCRDENCLNSDDYILKPENSIPLFKKPKIRKT